MSLPRPAALVPLCCAALLSSGCGVATVLAQCGWFGCPGDQAISARVRARFNAYPGLQSPNSISIQTLDHVVYLSGLVSTDTDRVLAACVAVQVKGVSRVVNNVAVTYSGH